MVPELIFLFSGKRKSGKDYLTDRLQEILGEDSCTILKISQPIKSHWAKSLNLDLNKLLSDDDYKEKYRLEMIVWSEEMRRKDYGCFCRIACENARSNKIWVVSDIRRKNDIKWFKETYGSKIKTVKVYANDRVRTDRGWIFTPGVDDVASECDLDDVNEWDFVIDNNNVSEGAREKLQKLLSTVNLISAQFVIEKYSVN